jgi:hypothetical protein
VGISLEYRVDGRRVSKDQFFKGMEEKVKGMASDQVRAAVERTRCAKHGRYARVVSSRKTAQGFQLDIQGCCDDLIERAQRAALS